jgi:DNA-binding response OmpR family regulator
VEARPRAAPPAPPGDADAQAARATVLVVDDDARNLHLVTSVLERAGFSVLQAEDGDVVVKLVRAHEPDLVVLDLMMRRVSGLEALRALRQAGLDVGVVILTGAGEEDVALQAFAAGADDYVTKPFPARVLIARLKAVLRRARRASPHDPAEPQERVGDVALDPLTHHAIVEGRSVPLSPTEYQLLRTLMRGAGRVFTATDLLTRVWGREYVGQDEIVRANIYRLRRKLERVPSQPRYIRGRRGVGYHFAAQPS